MKRYTVFDTKLGRYVVPLSREREAQARADLLNRIGNGKTANHWVTTLDVLGEEDEG